MKKGLRILFFVALLAVPVSTHAQIIGFTCPPFCITTVTASPVAVTTAQNTPVSVQFNGTTSSGALTYSTTTDPVHGTLSAITGNTVTYTPDAGYSGTDSFIYRAFSVPVSQTATVTITVTASAPSDTTPPVITAPADQYFSTTTIPAYPILVPATATDDSGAAPTITNNAPSSFAIGTTTITWTATDGSGNQSSVTSNVGVTQVDAWRISSNQSAALITESFTATATTFDGTSAYIPAAGATIGVVLSSSTSTVIATAVADASGQATFTISTPGSYAIGLEADGYGTTTPITITAPVVIPAPTPAVSIGNGPPVAATPVTTFVAPTPAPIAPAPTFASAIPAVSEPAPVTAAPPRHALASPTPKVAIAPVAPAVTEPAPAEVAVAAPVITPAPSQANTQLAAAAVSIDESSRYEALGLIIVLLALAGLLWQWKKRQSDYRAE